MQSSQKNQIQRVPSALRMSQIKINSNSSPKLSQVVPEMSIAKEIEEEPIQNGQEKDFQSEKGNSTGSTNQENSNYSLSEREWSNDKDSVETSHSDSLSFVNVISSLSLWSFVFLQIMKASGGWYGWIIVVLFYIIYLFECYHCTIFQGLLNRKANTKDLKQFINQLASNKPQITYLINKLQKSIISQENKSDQKPASDDVESQIQNKQCVDQEDKSSNQKKTQTKFEKSSINYEFEKMTNECLNVGNLIKTNNFFRLNIDIVSKINDEYSLLQWSKTKQQFIDQHSAIESSQILSSFEYVKQQQEEEERTFFIDENSQYKFRIAFLLFSFFSIFGLSLFFRVIFNQCIPTIRVKLLKTLSN